MITEKASSKPKMSYETVSDRKLVFCVHMNSETCKLCDYRRKSPLPTNSFHQIKHDICVHVAENSTKMIADLGCPNSVISEEDVKTFIQNLSTFQREHLTTKRVDEQFKFGPSGPYKCKEKLNFPVKNGSDLLWVDVAVVNAKIPMLLGNNVLKPLEAAIKLYSKRNGGNGRLTLDETEIELEETIGGHYTIKVADLAKLCGKTHEFSSYCVSKKKGADCETRGKVFNTEEKQQKHTLEMHESQFKCKVCEKRFFNKDSYKYHIEETQCTYGIKVMKPMLKNGKARKDDMLEEMDIDHIVTALNTQMNGSTSGREKELIRLVKQIAMVGHGKSYHACDECDETFSTKCTLKEHMSAVHENKCCACDECDKTFSSKCTLKEHLSAEHKKTCHVCDETLSAKCNPSEHLSVEHKKTCHACDRCGETFKTTGTYKEHTSAKQNVFLSHHTETDDDIDGIEFDPIIWNVLFSEDDVKELTETEKKEVLKLHRYFAHRSGRKLWENLFQPAGKLKGKKNLVMAFLDQCDVCRKYRRTPSRPKVGLPKAKDVNEVVSLDLKILKKSGKKEIGILYIHDEFSKLIKGKVINDKNSNTIVKGIESKWIIGGGAGPGHPSRGFFSDNGGEFLNDDLIDFAAALDITIRMTAASGPWMNGSCERAHATVDRIVEKLLEDEPKMDLQKAVDLACFVKNSEINNTGFSPLQLLCGKSPSFPGFSDCTPGSIELEGNNEYLKILKRMDEARVAARKIDCDRRIKVALKSKINSSLEKSYMFGDPIWFKLDSAHKWKSGTVLGKDGKVVFIRYGNFIRRVPLDRIVPAEEHPDLEEVELDQDDINNDERLEDDSFENVDIIVKKDKEIEQLKNKMKELETEIKKKHSSQTKIQKQTKPIDVLLPNMFKMISFQVDGNDEVITGKVLRKQKPNSIHKNIIGVQLENGQEIDFDFSNEVQNWRYIKEKPSDTVNENYVTKLTKAQVKGRKDVEKAMQDEISKFESFQAFKTVKDEGQYAIKTRWVYTEHDDESKGYKVKARLCMRGDTEENADNIRVDSPTAHKDSIKLALAIAANENFDIISADVKSAFLQGKTLDRDVFVIPPPEANQEGMLWLLQKGAYGLMDGSRLFYLEFKEKLEKFGMKVLSGDSAIFTMHKNAKLIGLVCIHVDDIFMSGNEKFKQLVKSKLSTLFQFSKIEEGKFKYLGCEIEKLGNGDIALNQNKYIESIPDVSVPLKKNSLKANEKEKKVIRSVVGELLWVSLMTRPDLSFDVNKLSSNISNATIKDVKDAARLVEKAKREPITLNFTHLGPKEDLKIRLFCDASFNNQDDKLRSTEGRVLLLENKHSSKSNLFSWKTKKISRICRSVKGAETRSLETGLDEAIHFARMVKEVYDGKVDLKSPKQVHVDALTDNKGLWENLHNTRQCDEKLLRNSIAMMKEMVERGEVRKIDWVETSQMLADIMTKQGGNGSWIKNVVSRNIV